MGFFELLLIAVNYVESVQFLHFRVVDWVHCFVCVSLFHKPDLVNVPFMQKFIGVVIRAYGGGMVAAALAGVPSGFILSAVHLPCLLLVYLIVMYSPFDIVNKILSIKIVLKILVLVDVVSTALAMIQGGIHRWQPIVQTFLSTVALSTVSATFGGVLASTFSLTSKEWQFQTPSVFTAPIAIIGAFFSAAIYYLIWSCSASPFEASFAEYCIPHIRSLELTKDHGKLLVIGIMIALKLLLI